MSLSQYTSSKCIDRRNLTVAVKRIFFRKKNNTITKQNKTNTAIVARVSTAAAHRRRLKNKISDTNLFVVIFYTYIHGYTADAFIIITIIIICISIIIPSEADLYGRRG